MGSRDFPKPREREGRGADRHRVGGVPGLGLGRYDGGGIYRSVWITAADPLHIKPWGLYAPGVVDSSTIRAAKDGGKEGLVADSVVKAQVTVTNADKAARTFTVQHLVLGSDGDVVSLGYGFRGHGDRDQIDSTSGPGLRVCAQGPTPYLLGSRE